MRSVFLDLASHTGLLACVSENEVIASHPIDHRIGDHELIPLIEHTLDAAGWTYAGLDRIACVTGPGGFTSLRVAVACVNALAWSLKLPVVGIHLWDLYAARPSPPAPLPAGRGGMLWLHSTKKDQLFVRGFGEWSKTFPEAECVPLSDLEEKIAACRGVRFGPKPYAPTWVGELIPEHHTIVDRLGMQEATLAPLQEILPRFLAGLTYGHDQLRPWYGRGW